MAEIKKSGIITICGRPNVGKSTLTNALVGEKVAIVTNKPQTTRNRICGVRTRGESQFVFVDTPGLHKARTRLGDYMVNVVKESVADVDAVMRCEDCKHLCVQNRKDIYAFCPKTNIVFLPFDKDTRTFFCSHGERKDETNES